MLSIKPWAIRGPGRSTFFLPDDGSSIFYYQTGPFVTGSSLNIHAPIYAHSNFSLTKWISSILCFSPWAHRDDAGTVEGKSHETHLGQFSPSSRWVYSPRAEEIGKDRSDFRLVLTVIPNHRALLVHIFYRSDDDLKAHSDEAVQVQKATLTSLEQR